MCVGDFNVFDLEVEQIDLCFLGDYELLSELGDVVVLCGLDKVIVWMWDFEIVIGESYEFGVLVVIVQYCCCCFLEEMLEIYVFFQIQDCWIDGFGVDMEGEMIFFGWMFGFCLV